jgi:molybdenum cofactor sulfurtransferase
MGPLGSRCEDTISACRLKVLHHFGADPSEYDVVFTSGSTSALKLVAECFPWSPQSALVYPFNAHTSVVGMREHAPSAYCIPSSLFHSSSSTPTPAHKPGTSDINGAGCYEKEDNNDEEVFYSLLTVPGECNFSGVTGVYE